MNFIESLVAGDVSADQIDDYRDQWDEDQENLEFHEYLGLLWPEYAMWVSDGRSLDYIAAARRAGKTLPAYLASQKDVDKIAAEIYSLCFLYKDEWMKILKDDDSLS
ncbi:hypothetical protein [Frankia tisae]|uniref:hypothetical protein n=1 Tax=Frankia tisae TaxID=2950104 RepID=UPI0021BF5E2F|nr:hypothetical protein [Frankia tisae]